MSDLYFDPILNRPRLKPLHRLAKRWIDFENAQTMNGRRLIGANAQYFTAPHAADLNVTTQLAVEICKKPYSTVNASDMCDVCKGTVGTGNAGWGVYTGVTTNYAGGVVRFATKNPSYSPIQTPEPSTEAEIFISHYLMQYNAGTVTVDKDGSSKTMTGSVAATLLTNTDVLRIGRDPGAVAAFGYKNANATYYLIRLYSEILTSEEKAIVGTDQYSFVPYAQLPASIQAKVLRSWEYGSLVCAKTGVELTPVVSSGTIDLETQIISYTDRASGVVYRSPMGRAMRLRTGIFGSGYSAQCDAVWDLSGAAGASRCGSRATLPSAPYTQSTGRLVSCVRYNTDLHATENFYSSVDGEFGVKTNSYVLKGYINSSGRYHGIRFRTNTGSYNSHWRTATSPAIDTTYKHDWYNDGSGMAHKLNGVASTLTAPSVPSWLNAAQDQNYGGANLYSTGYTPLCHLAYDIEFDGYPSARTNARLDAYLLAKYGT